MCELSARTPRTGPRDPFLYSEAGPVLCARKFIIDIIIVITVLGVLMAMSKSCLFHMEAVGRWDHGHAYKFSYALSLTMIVFLLTPGGILW